MCRACGTDLGGVERVGRRDTCSRCGVDLHSCRQCRFHDLRAYNECAEPQAERVLDKNRGNFCEYFTPADPSRSAISRAVGAATPAAANAEKTAPSAREELDRLFRRR